MTHPQVGRGGIVLGGGIDPDVDSAIVRVCQPGAGVARDQVLSAQFVADLAEGRIQPLQAAGVKILSPGVARELNECVLPAGIASCAALNGNDDDAVEDHFRLPGFAEVILYSIIIVPIES